MDARIAAEDRARMAEWKERRGLRIERVGRCLHWLAEGRCNSPRCMSGVRTKAWQDHAGYWKDDKGGRLMVCEPYQLTTDDLLDLAATVKEFDLTVSVHGRGPYGHGTVAIELRPRTPSQALPYSMDTGGENSPPDCRIRRRDNQEKSVVMQSDISSGPEQVEIQSENITGTKPRRRPAGNGASPPAAAAREGPYDLPIYYQELIAEKPERSAEMVLVLLGREWADDEVLAAIRSRPKGIGSPYVDATEGEILADIARLRGSLVCILPRAAGAATRRPGQLACASNR